MVLIFILKVEGKGKFEDLFKETVKNTQNRKILYLVLNFPVLWPKEEEEEEMMKSLDMSSRVRLFLWFSSESDFCVFSLRVQVSTTTCQDTVSGSFHHLHHHVSTFHATN